MQATVPVHKLGLILKLGFFIFLVVIGVPLFAIVLSAGGYLIAAAGSTFGAGITANALSVRVFERASLTLVGLGWRSGSARNALYGFLAGAVGAACVTVVPMLLGVAYLVPDPERPASFASILFVTLVLLFGAIGEELLFRGYGFQLLSGNFGVIPGVVISSLAFGAVHMTNLNASTFGIVNTVAYGVVLAYAVLRTGELWAAIGIHFGWNLVLPLAGVSLSGFKIGLTGYALRWRVSELWSGGEYGPEAGVLTTFVVVALLVFLRKAPLLRSPAPLLDDRKQEA
jgi:membrane protease YdiL (CAAX protease family)